MKHIIMVSCLMLSFYGARSQCSLSFEKEDITCFGEADGSATVIIEGASASSADQCVNPSPSPESCTTGCTPITDNSPVTANTGDVYCITADNYTGSLQLDSGGKVIICGLNASPSGIIFNGGELVINNELTIPQNLEYWTATSTVTSYGSLNFPSSSSFDLPIINHGNITANGELTIESNGVLTNYGSCSISAGDMINEGELINYGTVSIPGDFSNIHSGTFTNNCTFTVFGSFIASGGAVGNNSLINISGDVSITGGSYTASESTELTIGGNFTVRVPVSGTGTECSSIRLSNNANTTIEWGASFSGKIRLCDPDGIETNNPGISSPYLDCNCQLSDNSCAFVWENSLGQTVGTGETVTGLSPGSYTVEVSCTGCENSPLSETVEIIEPVALSLSVITEEPTCAGDNLGNVDLSVSGGTTPYSYDWSNGEATEDLTGVGPGTYEVIVTDSNGCTEPETVVLENNNGIQILSTKKDILCNGNSTGSIDISVSGGSGEYIYSWSNGSTLEDISGISAGTYTITVTDSEECSTSRNIIIDEPLPITISSEFTDVTCSGLGSIDITVSGGVSPYTYFWSNNKVTEDISELEAGSYNVTVTDDNECPAQHTVQVEESLPFDVTTDHTDISTYGAADGSATVTVDGGEGPGSSDFCEEPSLSGEDCNSGCTNTFSANSGTVTINAGEKVCLTSTNFTGTIAMNDGELVICGAAAPASFTFHGGAITVNGTLNISSGTSMNTNSTIDNFGTLDITDITISGDLNNHSTITSSSGSLTLFSEGSLYNTGTINYSGGDVISNGSMTNSGSLTVSGDMDLKGGSETTNNCEITVGNNLGIESGNLLNRGIITASSFNVANAGSGITLNEGSSMELESLSLSASVTVTGTGCAVIQVSEYTSISSGITITGDLSLCDANGVEHNQSPGITGHFNCDCQLQQECSVAWSNGESGETIAGLNPGLYTATITCGNCSTTREFLIEENGFMLINTVNVNEGSFTVSVPGVNDINASSGLTSSEVTFEPTLPFPGEENHADLLVSPAEDNKELELRIIYNHLSQITGVQALFSGNYLDLNEDYYTITDQNKLYLYNGKPKEAGLNITTNLVNGLLLDPDSRELEISIPANTAFTSTMLSIAKIDQGTVQEVLAATDILTWDGQAATAGLYEFQLELESDGLTKTYKGQFIVE